MTRPRIGIIISSTREKRFGEKAARWIHGLAARRTDLDFEIVDLRDYPMPFFEGISPLHAPVTDEAAIRWGRKMAELDGYLFVTAEYNRSITGVLKNALDWAYREFNRKPAAYLGYGGVGGARAIEQLRLICVELQMAPTRPGVHIAGSDATALIFQGKSFEELELPHLVQAANIMLDDLAWWTFALKATRDASAA
ncbi:NADPH-dependent FMN reductase [Microvirga puerhi]|uniref:NAD(P)H-dependent oxidoreductase n=1 Tax=Microvirga puerhi TaxID=2876078 RepID=A0ABS7VV43_9HYPH|nr:NAD(P)H-dependent oxidoreductase [Microvirga puerhi]